MEVGHGPYPSVGPGGSVSPQVQQWFQAVDKDRSGFITALELKGALVNGQGQTFSETACNLMIGKKKCLLVLVAREISLIKRVQNIFFRNV